MKTILRKALIYALDRAKEPSSWAGMTGIALAAGVSAPAYDVFTTAIAGVAGLIAFAIKEQPKS